MYAIIRDRGRQYQVSVGDVLDVDLMDEKKQGEGVLFKDVLLTSDGNGAVRVGEPTLQNAAVHASVVDPLLKGPKIDIVHFRAKKDSMDKKGHRQPYTRIKIEKIEVA